MQGSQDMQKHIFSLEQPRKRRMLLASIADAPSNNSGGGLRLPRLVATAIPDTLRATVKRLGSRSPGSARDKQQPSPGAGSRPPLRSHRLQPPDLSQLHHAAAAAGGLLVAVSQAAARLASVRPGRGSQTLPFYQSFKLPWNVGARSGSRRCS